MNDRAKARIAESDAFTLLLDLSFRAEIDPLGLGYDVQAIIDLKLRPNAEADAFERVLETTRGVVEWTLVTGGFDYMLRVVCLDQEDLVRLIESLRRSGFVGETQSRIYISSLCMKNYLLRFSTFRLSLAYVVWP